MYEYKRETLGSLASFLRTTWDQTELFCYTYTAMRFDYSMRILFASFTHFSIITYYP
jgi:hypothetical protein